MLPLAGLLAVLACADGSSAPATTAANDVEFGEVDVGGSAARNVTLTNTTATPIDVADVITSGAGVWASGRALPFKLAPGESMPLSLEFAPTTTGDVEGSVSFLSASGTESLARIKTGGRGVKANTELVPEPTAIGFADVAVGARVTQDVTLTNTGARELTVASVSTSAAGVTATGLPLPATFAPGESATFTIAFAPTSAGAVSGTVALKSEFGRPLAIVDVTGSGVSPTAPVTLTATPTRLDFPNVTVGTFSAQGVTLTNASAEAVTVSQVAVSGAGFSASGLAVPTTLAAGSAATVSVKFTPAATGPVTGQLVIQGASGVEPLAVVELAGSAVQAASITSVTVRDATVEANKGVQLQADVVAVGTIDKSVTWSVESGSLGTVAAGTGVYTAPAVPGTYHVVATSNADSTKRGVGTVTVTAPPPVVEAPQPVVSPFCDKLVRDTTQRSQGSLAKPGYLRSVIDPVFGTRITRISGDPGTPIGGTGLTWGMRSRHSYSKMPAWSVPDAQGRSILFLNWTDKGPIWLDGDTYEPLLRTKPSWYSQNSDYRWHPVLPDVLVAVNRTSGDINFWNIRTNAMTRVYAGGLSSSVTVAMGAGEGNLSIDGKYVAINVGSGTSGPPYFFVVDLSACMPTYSAGCGVKRTGNVSVTSVGISSLDWVSISPLGNYVVVSRNSTETAVLDWDKRTGVVNTTRRAQFASGHFDLTVDASGAEVAVGGNGQMFRLADGSRKTILATNNSQYHAGAQHLDASFTAASDWAWGSQEGSSSSSLYRGEIIAFGTNGQFYRLAHHRTNLTTHTNGTECAYDRCPYATPSRDGRRVLFASDWGNPTGPIEAYIVDTGTVCP